jgi:hypothetical protein
LESVCTGNRTVGSTPTLSAPPSLFSFPRSDVLRTSHFAPPTCHSVLLTSHLADLPGPTTPGRRALQNRKDATDAEGSRTKRSLAYSAPLPETELPRLCSRADAIGGPAGCGRLGNSLSRAGTLKGNLGSARCERQVRRTNCPDPGLWGGKGRSRKPRQGALTPSTL